MSNMTKARGALFAALALGAAYSDKATGYEYFPAPGIKRDRPPRRSGIYTSPGRAARTQSWRRRNYEREVAQVVRSLVREGQVVYGGESWEHFITARLARGVPSRAAGAEWVGAS